MKCMECHKPLNAADMKKSTKVMEDGRLKGILCAGCKNKARKEADPLRDERGRYSDTSPTLEEGAALRRNATDIEQEQERAAREALAKTAEERQPEYDERREDDWREPASLDMDELLSGP